MTGRESEELGLLASITAAIEASKTEVTDIEISTTDRVCRGNVRLSIPLENIKRLDDARIDMEQARVVEEELQIDLNIEIDMSETNAHDDDSTTLRRDDDDDSGSDDDLSHDGGATEACTDDCVAGSRHSFQEPAREENQTRSGDKNESEMAELGDDETAAEGGRSDDTINDNSVDSEPDSDLTQRPYRDPEKLAAVYDENTTFKEMKADLDTDVTAQTIRKYMIKYGIHDPKQRPDRLLESIRPSEFDLMNDDDENE